MPIFAGEMVRPCKDIDNVLQQICQRLRKLEKSDSEKPEEIGRLNRIIDQKNVEIHNLKTELANSKARVSELESQLGENDGSSPSSDKSEKNSSNSSVPPSKESILAHELRRTKSLRKPSGRPSDGQSGHKGSTLQTVSTPDRIVRHEPECCKVLRPTSWRCKIQENPQDPGCGHQVRHGDDRGAILREGVRVWLCEQLRCSQLPYQIWRQPQGAYYLPQCGAVYAIQEDCRVNF
jgi:hypothetical protein